MPGVITSDQIVVKAAEVTADYLVLGTFASAQALNDDIKVEGTNAINGRVSANTAWSLAAPAVADVNMTVVDVTTGSYHVWQWIKILTWPSADTVANGGLGISISSDVTPTQTGVSPSDGPTNSKTWYLGGSDTDATTGWVCYCVDPNGTPNLTIGSPAINSVSRIGLRAKIVGTVSNKTLNVQHDVIRYGTGLTILTGSTAQPVTLTDVFTRDSSNTNAWGVITRQSGINFLAGKLYIGATTQTASTVFKDTDQVVVYRKFPVSSSFYEIKLRGASAANNTTFQLGTFSASLASAGVTIKGEGDAAATGTLSHAVWTLSASAIHTTCSLYASTFSEMKNASFANSTQVRYCSFVNFGDITTNGATIDNCTFQKVKTTAPVTGVFALIVNSPTEMSGITNSNFINCNKAIKLGFTGTYTFSGLTFSGNAYDVENASIGLVTINVVGGGTTPTTTSSNGGTTVVNSNVQITLTGLKNPSEVRVYSAGTQTEIAGQENVTGGTFAFSVGSGVQVDISILALGYQNQRILAYSTTTDTSLPVSQQLDRQYLNP